MPNELASAVPLPYAPASAPRTDLVNPVGGHMAIWQFDFHLLPAASVERWCRAVPVSIGEDDFDCIQWWDGIALDPSLAAEVSALLPPGSSWNPRIAAWGTEDGNRFAIWKEDAQVVEIFARIDVRHLSLLYIHHLIDIIRRHDLLIVTDLRHVLHPSVDELLAAIHRSASFAFVSDPRRFLSELASRRQASE